MIEIDKIKLFLINSKIDFNENVDMKTKTWIKRGGTARIWIQPTNMPQFETLITWCQLNKIQFEVIGNTSNCYFLNEYHPELVISTLNLNEMHINEKTITCDCGYNMTRLSKYCISKGIAGYEGFIGLPGTVGGAAINNSGCYGSFMYEVVESLRLLINGEVHLLTNEQLIYKHRDSILKSKIINGIVTSVTFNINSKTEPSILEKRAEEFQLHRLTFQEHTYPNLGSIFSVLEFKRLRFLLHFTYKITQNILNLLIRNTVKKQKLNTKLILRLRKAGKFREYISEYGIGCFTWKDTKADSFFVDYLNFINKETTKIVIEIDIKGKKE